MAKSGLLTVDFCGEVHEVEEGDELTFGRLADLSVDDNPYMHRILGRLESRHGRWWIVNLGSSIVLEIFDRTTHSKVSLAPSADQVLPGDDVVVRFSAGPTVYEIDLKSPPVKRYVQSPLEVEGETIRASDLPMTESQLLLILSLAEHKLLNPHKPLVIPPTKTAAARLGWPTTKFNRKLDNVCEKLSREGVTGLTSRPGEVASQRRRKLVEHAVTHGLVDESMLGQLDRLSTSAN